MTESLGWSQILVPNIWYSQEESFQVRQLSVQNTLFRLLNTLEPQQTLFVNSWSELLTLCSHFLTTLSFASVRFHYQNSLHCFCLCRFSEVSSVLSSSCSETTRVVTKPLAEQLTKDTSHTLLVTETLKVTGCDWQHLLSTLALSRKTLSVTLTQNNHSCQQQRFFTLLVTQIVNQVETTTSFVPHRFLKVQLTDERDLAEFQKQHFRDICSGFAPNVFHLNSATLLDNFPLETLGNDQQQQVTFVLHRANKFAFESLRLLLYNPLFRAEVSVIFNYCLGEHFPIEDCYLEDLQRHFETNKCRCILLYFSSDHLHAKLVAPTKNTKRRQMSNTHFVDIL